MKNMKYMREMNLIPKNWKDALRLWRIKKKYPKKEILFIKGKYYYKGILLQLKDNNDTGTFYYKKVIWEIEE